MLDPARYASLCHIRLRAKLHNKGPVRWWWGRIFCGRLHRFCSVAAVAAFACTQPCCVAEA